MKKGIVFIVIFALVLLPVSAVPVFAYIGHGGHFAGHSGGHFGPHGTFDHRGFEHHGFHNGPFFGGGIFLGPGPWWPPSYYPNYPPGPNYWYYCTNPPGYFPYVTMCSNNWLTVPAE